MIPLICGFPGVGKSYFAKHIQEMGVEVLDSDSSKWAKDQGWPHGYVHQLRQEVYNPNGPHPWVRPWNKLVLASTHEEVLESLEVLGVPYVLVYPTLDAKTIYLQRYRDRGSSDAFIQTLDANWEIWIKALMLRTGNPHVILTPNQHLTDLAHLLVGGEAEVQ